MALKIYARHGGAAAASQDDITDRIPILDGVPGTPIVQMGMGVQNGGASQGTLLVPDPTANDDASLYFPPHTQITLTEDATGDELMLAQGRISGFQIGRAPGSQVEDAVEWTLTIDDANVDFRGLAFTEDWVRPVETGMARLYALALYTLNGTSSTRPDYGGAITYRPSTAITISASHLAPNTNTVVMPAKTYPAGTQPQEVANDVCTTEGKVYGVVPHHTGGSSHLCALVIKESDHSTYASTVKISDQLADWDPDDLTAPVFEPIWDQGKGQVVDGNANISGLVSRYALGDHVVVSVSETLGDDNEYWVDAYQDGDSVDPTQAANRAASIIAYRAPFQETDRCSIEMLPEQHSLITAGMSIQVKAAAVAAGTVSTLGTYVNRRIVSLTWEPRANGKLHAILQLNRPTRTAGVGKAQPASTSATGAPDCDDTAPYGFALSVDDSGWEKRYEDPPVYAYDEGNVSASGSSAILGYSFGTAMGPPEGDLYEGGAVRNLDYEPDVAEEMLFRFSITELGYTLPSYAVNQLVLSNGRAISIAPGNFTRPKGAHIRPQGDDDGTFSVDGAAGTTTITYVWEENQDYYVRLIRDGGSAKLWKAEDPEPGSWTVYGGDTGYDGGLYLENAPMSDAGDVNAAPSAFQVDSLTVFPLIDDPFCLTDPGSSPYYAKSDDPRFDTIVTDHGGMTGLLDDDHTQYIKDSEFGARGRILVGTGAGTFDDLPVGTDTFILTADSGEAMGVKWAAAPSGTGPFEQYDATNWNFISPYTTLISSSITGAYISLNGNEMQAGGDGTAYLLITGDLSKFVGDFGLVLPVASSDPAGGDSEIGQVYYNDGSNKLRWYNGSAWADLGGPTHVYSEVPSGTINGSNAAFTLAATPASGTLRLYKNGLRQRAGSGNDYTLSGSTITYESGNVPQTGDSHVADYDG